MEKENIKRSHMRWLLLSLAVFSILINIFLFREFRSGDAFISMYYGMNLYEGRYLEINENEPSSGASSPLWMMLHTAVRPLSIHFSDLYTHFLFMKGLNVLLLMLSALVLLRIMEESKTSPILQVVVLLSWVLNPFVVNWTTRCLEVPLQALTCWYSLYRIFFQGRQGRKWVPFVDGVVFGLVLLTRYESGLLLLLLGIYALISKRWRWPVDPLMVLLGFLFVYGHHLWFMLSTFGTIFPSTAAKGGALAHSGMEPLKHLLAFYGPFLLVFLANVVRYREMSPLKRLVTLWVIGHLGFVGLVLGYSHLQRYFLVVIPLMIWIALESPMLSFLTRYLVKMPVKWAVSATSVGVLLLTGGLFFYGTRDGTFLNRFIAFQREDLKTRTAMAEYIQKNIPPQATVAMAELDWIPLYSRCRILDIVGILYDDVKDFHWDFAALLKDRQPEYLILEENFIRSTARVSNTIDFKRKLLDLLRGDDPVLALEGMSFERVFSVPYHGAGGQMELFKGNFQYEMGEREQWQWYLLKVHYS